MLWQQPSPKSQVFKTMQVYMPLQLHKLLQVGEGSQLVGQPPSPMSPWGAWGQREGRLLGPQESSVLVIIATDERDRCHLLSQLIGQTSHLTPRNYKGSGNTSLPCPQEVGSTSIWQTAVTATTHVHRAWQEGFKSRSCSS